ncbi:hypothetical protein HYZ80_03010 [Candidatus Parcubacteria bacterium]|nr:hypothetical protein [Candidatus Parcubacteria bacterium]
MGRRVSVIVGMLLWLYLLVFFWIFLGELRSQIFPFLAGMVVSAVWALIAAPIGSCGKLGPDANTTLVGCFVGSMYTVLAGALVGTALVEGPRGWIRFIAVAAVVSLAVLLWPTAKQIKREYAEAVQG